MYMNDNSILYYMIIDITLISLIFIDITIADKLISKYTNFEINFKKEEHFQKMIYKFFKLIYHKKAEKKIQFHTLEYIARITKKNKQLECLKIQKACFRKLFKMNFS